MNCPAKMQVRHIKAKSTPSARVSYWQISDATILLQMLHAWDRVSPHNLKVRCIIHSHHLVIVGCHDSSATFSCVEDFYGICDAIVIVCDPHTAVGKLLLSQTNMADGSMFAMLMPSETQTSQHARDTSDPQQTIHQSYVETSEIAQLLRQIEREGLDAA